MLFKQFYLGCLAHASYIVGDEKTQTAAVIDPQRDIDQYLEYAREHGLTIKYVLLTHFHADFLAGHLELRDKVGAEIVLGDQFDTEYDFTPIKDGEGFEFGDVRLELLHTPGHTPEGLTILVYDLTESREKPYGALTGDTLFIGDVGRPDLLASVGYTAEQLGRMLYHSLREKVMKLPDETKVFPAHGAGSLCGRNLSDETVSTIGEQKRYNYALWPMSEDEFLKLVTENQPEAPKYFVHDAILNRKERQTLEEVLSTELNALSLDEVLKQQESGAQVLDVRDEAEFAGAHLKGSLNIPLAGKYATWCGTLLDKEKPIVIISEAGKEDEAAMRLGRIGFDNVIGYLKGGMEALAHRPDLVQKIPRITAQALEDQLDSENPPLVLDVRSGQEHEESHIEGAMNIPLNHLRERVDELPDDCNFVVHCGSGYRSSIASSILQQEGCHDFRDLVGGYGAWQGNREKAKA